MTNPADNDSDHHDLPPVILVVASAPERRIIERSNIGARRITVLQAGIGPGQVRSALQNMPMHELAGLVSFGTAGGLTPELLPGRLLIPIEVATEDGVKFPVTSQWRDRVCRQLDGHGIENGTIVSVSRAVRSPGDKRQLRDRTGAVAVDMESAELARIAARHSLPFLVVRAVADPLERSIPHSAVAALTERGNFRFAGLFRQLLRHPGEIADLMSLAAHFRAAGQSLETCCRAAGEQISRTVA